MNHPLDLVLELRNEDKAHNKPFFIEYKGFSEDYHRITKLGQGSFGSAYLVKYRHSPRTVGGNHDKAGTLLQPLEYGDGARVCADGVFAVKTMRQPVLGLSECYKLSEIRFALCVEAHHNLVQLYDIFADSRLGLLHIVMEPMQQSLFQFMNKGTTRKLARSVLRLIMQQLLSAIQHIHLFGLYHRDVKPENILISAAKSYFNGNVPTEWRGHRYVIKLCDFGLSRHTSNRKDLTPYVLTRWYRAPEIILRQDCYLSPVDIWAFACVCMELVRFRPLFPGANEFEQLMRILVILGHPTMGLGMGGYWPEALRLAESQSLRMPIAEGAQMSDLLPNDQFWLLREALGPCFSWNPEHRPTALELAAHPYFDLLPTAPLPLETVPADSWLRSNFEDEYRFAAEEELRESFRSVWRECGQSRVSQWAMESSEYVLDVNDSFRLLWERLADVDSVPRDMAPSQRDTEQKEAVVGAQISC